MVWINHHDCFHSLHIPVYPPIRAGRNGSIVLHSYWCELGLLNIMKHTNLHLLHHEMYVVFELWGYVFCGKWRKKMVLLVIMKKKLEVHIQKSKYDFLRTTESYCRYKKKERRKKVRGSLNAGSNKNKCKKHWNGYFSFLGSRAPETAQEPRNWPFLFFWEKVAWSKVKNFWKYARSGKNGLTPWWQTSRNLTPVEKTHAWGCQWNGVGGYPTKKIRANNF